eukprot:gene31683-6888_t
MPPVATPHANLLLIVPTVLPPSGHPPRAGCGEKSQEGALRPRAKPDTPGVGRARAGASLASTYGMQRDLSFGAVPGQPAASATNVNEGSA